MDKKETVVVINTPPPEKLYKKIREKFPVDWEQGVVFTYGNNIYSKVDVSRDLFIHEMMHSRQQNAHRGGPDAWWDKYLSDDEFRLEQEIEAYHNQYRWIIANVPDHNKSHKMLLKLSNDLSSPMYGSII